VLTGLPVHSEDEAITAAHWLAADAGVRVLAKGGHIAPEATGQVSLGEGARRGDLIADHLLEPDGSDVVWTDPRIETVHTHGTGCTLATAIATGLGQGMTLEASIAVARAFVRASLAAAPGLGSGHGPMGQQFATGFRCPA
jgi:hydroxymethylpyrimidine/phosphomethylpyrimidine kinase